MHGLDTMAALNSKAALKELSKDAEKEFKSALSEFKADNSNTFKPNSLFELFHSEEEIESYNEAFVSEMTDLSSVWSELKGETAKSYIDKAQELDETSAKFLKEADSLEERELTLDAVKVGARGIVRHLLAVNLRQIGERALA